MQESVGKKLVGRQRGRSYIVASLWNLSGGGKPEGYVPSGFFVFHYA